MPSSRRARKPAGTWVASLPPLVPLVVDAVNVPVVAAGGIADGRGFLAALALGAAGVQLGTRLIATPESDAGEIFKQRVLDATETDTLVTSALTGKPVRTIATPSLKDYESARTHGADADELKALQRAHRKAAQSRRPEEFAAVAGQISGMIHDIHPVQVVFDALLREAIEIAAQLNRLANEGQ